MSKKWGIIKLIWDTMPENRFDGNIHKKSHPENCGWLSFL
jgi:hypothetical protein